MKHSYRWVLLGVSALVVSLSQAQSLPPQPILKRGALKKPPSLNLPANTQTLPIDKTIGAGIVKIPPRLKGYVDLHTHPMSHLGFGRKAMHGAPDVGMILPAGTRDCNKTPLRSKSMEDALGHCNSTHGGWGVDNTCGDSLRAAVIHHGVDPDFVHNVKTDRNLHGDHAHAGYPRFDFWPHHSSKLHQQMWWEWIRRAKEGGLRVMVALTVNSEILAEALNGDGPYDDKSVADVQIDETIRLVNQHSDFMEVAKSAADVRRIVQAGKLAVVLGMEVDKLGNFGKPRVRTDEQAVRAEIRRLHAKGVRYVFPIHLIDNAFGGSAVYEALFNFANKQSNGYHFHVTSDASTGYNAQIFGGPRGVDNVALAGIQTAMKLVGEVPAPCFNDAIKCSPLPGKVRCCGNYERLSNMIKPSPELDAYADIPRGHVNALGLTWLGQVAIDEMMKLGMLIDVDHMSERALRSTVVRAASVPGGYPLVMGHNGVRGPNGKERAVPPDLLASILEGGGMLGLGTSDTTPAQALENYGKATAAVHEVRTRGSIGIGSDANGFEPLPGNGRAKPASAAALKADSDRFYQSFFRESGITQRSQKPSGGAWDYIVDGGVSHYGLMPEFLHDVKSRPGGETLHEEWMASAEYFAGMWERAEAASKRVSEMPRGGTYSFTSLPLTNLCPSRHVGGDREYSGNGPTLKGRVVLGINGDGSRLQATVSVDFKETKHDWSQVTGEWTVPVGEPAPAGLRYTRILSNTTVSFTETLSGGGRNAATEGCDGGQHTLAPGDPVSRLIVVGDTGGDDISNDHNCHCDTRIVSLELKPIQAALSPR